MRAETEVHPTATEREKEMRRVLVTLWNDAYLAARYDSLVQDSVSLTAYLDPGVKYQWARLKKGNVDEGILSDIGFREKLWRGRSLKFREAAKVQEDILTWCENNGYPFASIRLDSVTFPDDHSLSAVLHLEKNRFTKIDSIEMMLR